MNNDQWSDWRWQLKSALRTSQAIKTNFNLSEAEEKGLLLLKSQQSLPLQITPHFLSLIDVDNQQDPLRLQVIPRAAEFEVDTIERNDPLGEVDHEVVPHLVHRYPDRVLLLVTDRCASYCRFCTRKRWVGQGPTPKPEHLAEALEYIKMRPEIKEVIISGGDPLLLDDYKLDNLLHSLREITSLEIIRFDTRILTFAPMRITAELVTILKKYQPIYIVAHFNHVHEINDCTKKAFAQLIDNGIMVLNQSVLLQNINDSSATLTELFRKLTYLRVRPYYLHQCDLARGTKIFRVPLKRALGIVKEMRGQV